MPKKSNKLKIPEEKVDKKVEKKTSSKRKTVKKKKSNTKRNFNFDIKYQRVLGFFFLLFSIYILLSISSFIVNWFEANPSDELSKTISSYFSDHAKQVEVWTGKFGSILSSYIVLKGFGLGAFFIPLLFLAIGFKLLINSALFKTWTWFQLITISFLWIPVLFNMIFPDHPENILGGLLGHHLNIWLANYIGKVGMIFSLIFVPAVFILIDYQFNFRRNKKKKEIESDNKTVSTVSKDDLYNTVEFSVKDADEENDLLFEEEKKDKPSNTFKIELDTAVKKEKQKNEEKSSEIEFTVEKPKEEKVSEDKVKPGEHFGVDSEYDPTLDLPNFKMPPINLLEENGSENIEIDSEELERNKVKIVNTLKNYSIEITKIKATIGPTVTLYEIVPAPGVRISKIKNLEDDIALNLAAMGIRIIAPIPGKGTVGIEVPNKNPNTVSMRSIIGSDRFRNSKYELPFGLGKTIANESFVADLTKMPHILMAGATGQGKSVGLNAIIASLLYTKHPAELKFVMVDPKKVELTLFSRIERHYLAKLPDSEEAIITDTRKVVRTLNSLGIEMDHRYELLKDAQVRNLKEYNRKFIARKLNPNQGHKYLPYIVLVIDEFADLIMTAGKEVENPITRLAQLARAVGIHLIIATQRPSVNIITGTIKANFPARIAFRVISKVDSRTILDSGGADQLIGRGDMLLSTGSDITRLQCAFIDTPEVDKLTEYIGSQRAYPDAFFLPEYEDEELDKKAEYNAEERDELLEDAAYIIVQNQQGSTSLLQRKLKLGYNRAGRIIDQLEAAGIVGPFEGSKAREVRVANEMALEQFLKDLNSPNDEN
ncbi:MAG: cell division protein FtsK [Marinilabiliales bacterium]|nr:MAG: cell division protein FtsK [Marinilabiliales bacterium]